MNTYKKYVRKVELGTISWQHAVHELCQEVKKLEELLEQRVIGYDTVPECHARIKMLEQYNRDLRGLCHKRFLKIIELEKGVTGC